MMRQKLLWSLMACFFLCMPVLYAQVPQVGHSLEFAGMKLHLSEQARRDIQSNVDALYRSERFFNLRLEQVDLYMPLIEPIFEKYGVPEEFKYLVIQESGLVPDAVSSSNAVGFWQFKEESATELGLRVDRQVDERMNIVSATEGAAKYLLRSNAEFDNWIYTLQSYMVGQGGTSRSVDKRHYGAREMKIDGDTHWYIKKFLSHMVAYEHVTGKQIRYKVLYAYTNGANKSLHHIAREFDTEEEELKAYNKWLKTSQVPDDKPYTIIIPLQVDQSQDLLAQTAEAEEEKEEERENEAYGHKQQKPEKPVKVPKGQLALLELNDLEGVIAREGDKVETLADLGNISDKRFRKYNDMQYGDKVEAGRFYYLQKKRRRARVYEHVLQPGESLWDVAQQYGVRLKKLRQKNRLKEGEEPKAGRVLWLRFIRPSHIAVEHREVKPPKEPLYASTKQKSAPAREALMEEQEVKEQPQGVMPKEQQQADVVLNPVDTLADQEVKEKKPVETGEAFGKYQMQADTPVVSQKAIDMPEKKQEQSPLPLEEEAPQAPADSLIRKVQEQKQEKVQSPTTESAVEDKPQADSFAVEEPVTLLEAESPAKDHSGSTHTVKAGETLYSLSRQYGVTVQDLIRWNHLPAQPVLSIGQELSIKAPKSPATTAVPAETKTTTEEPSSPKEESNHRYHIVAPGESMYRVARMYNVTIKDIMRWNNKESFDIKEGERLVVGME